MPDVEFLENIYLALLFFVPGLVVLFVRSQFVTGAKFPHSAAWLPYLAISVIYYGLAFPLIDFVVAKDQPIHGRILAWYSLVFAGPAVLGLVLGINIQKDLFRRLLQRYGLNPVHVIPTAWDWKFGNMTEQWVLVTLKDGTRFAGLCGSDSFKSSDPIERDIYIQEVYDLDDDDNWSSSGEKALLIAAGEVQTIEFWPYAPQESYDVQREEAGATNTSDDRR